MKKIVADSHICSGCRTCELACSHHRARIFSPEISSVRVSKNSATGEIVIQIRSTCDLCENEQAPLCVKFCAYDALKLEEGH